MPFGVHGVTAQWASGAPGSHNLTGPLGEGAGCAYRHAYQQHLGFVRAVLVKGFFIVLGIEIGDGVGLNDNLCGGGIPAQAHGSGTELLFNGFKGVVVHELDGGPCRHAERVALNCNELVEYFVDFLCELGRLLLLHGNTDDLFSRTYLQVERPGPWEANGANYNPVRPGKLVNTCRHVSILGTSGSLRVLPCSASHRSIAGMDAVGQP